jgi:hypothetical protein
MIFERRDPYRSAGPGGTVQCRDYSHVLQAFFSRWFRFPIMDDAFRKEEKLRGELVAFWGFVRRLFTIDNEFAA